jgi:ribonuclease D
MTLHTTIKTARDFARYCDDLRQAPLIAFDTEFVSEDRFRPQLCLLQVATPESAVVIDPLAVSDVGEFWELVANFNGPVIVHAGREEIRFCYRASGRKVANLFDVQLAAGFIGMDYPASYGNLIHRYLGQVLDKGETRTDWRRRPLTEHQLDYALQDVTHLPSLYELLRERLERRQRLEWLYEEVDELQTAVMQAEAQESWRRVPGGSTLPPRQSAVLRELWRWRENEARQADIPARRVLRDDLLIELAKRGTDDVRRIRSLRGMERRTLGAQYEAIAEAIRRALELPESELPRRVFGERRSQAPLLTQFVGTAIACISRQHHLAPAIVGNAEDVRDLLAYEQSGRKGHELPHLLRGWRGEVIGNRVRELLAGKLAIRIADAGDELPVEFCRVAPDRSLEGP